MNLILNSFMTFDKHLLVSYLFFQQDAAVHVESRICEGCCHVNAAEIFSAILVFFVTGLTCFNKRWIPEVMNVKEYRHVFTD